MRVDALYRGQPHGAAIGTWWSSDEDEARAHVRARHRSWELLRLDCDPDWAERFVTFAIGEGADNDKPSIYCIPVHEIARYMHAIRIIDGFVEVVESTKSILSSIVADDAWTHMNEYTIMAKIDLALQRCEVGGASYLLHTALGSSAGAKRMADLCRLAIVRIEAHEQQELG